MPASKPKSELLRGFAPPPAEDDIRHNLDADSSASVSAPTPPPEEMVYLSVRVPKVLRKQAKLWAVEHNMTDQDMVMRAVRELMEREP
jgi:hypothetical protein